MSELKFTLQEMYEIFINIGMEYIEDENKGLTWKEVKTISKLTNGIAPISPELEKNKYFCDFKKKIEYFICILD